MTDWGWLLAVVVAYVAVTQWILPKLGVHT